MKKAVDKKRTRSLWRRIQHTTEGTKKREEGTPRKKNVLVRQTSQIGYSSYKRKEEKERRRNVAWEKKEKNPVQEEKKTLQFLIQVLHSFPLGRARGWTGNRDGISTSSLSLVLCSLWAQHTKKKKERQQFFSQSAPSHTNFSCAWGFVVLHQDRRGFLRRPPSNAPCPLTSGGRWKRRVDASTAVRFRSPKYPMAHLSTALLYYCPMVCTSDKLFWPK